MVRVVGWVTLLIFGAACNTNITHQEEDLVAGGITPPGEDPSQCEICPPGYTPVGTECVWFGGPRNGDFTEATEWETQGSVVLDPDALGLGGPGAARFLAEAKCTGASIRQSFEMPSYACAEPLALTLATSSTCTFCVGETLDIDINGGRHRHLAGLGEAEVCLGERAYGQIARLSISTAPSNCFADGELVVDDVDVWPAVTREPSGLDEDLDVVVCAPPGTIVNGDFEEGMPGWHPASEEAAEVGVGYGFGATRGVRLSSPTCEPASIQGTASLPMHENTPNPAVELWVNGAGPDPVVVSYGQNALGAVSEASQQTVRLCIPRWAQGVSEPLHFGLAAFDSGCPDPRTEYRLDQVAIVSDPSCAHGVGVFDGSFEELAKAQTASSWWRDGKAMPSAEQAYDGDASLLLELGATCEPAAARQTVTLPVGAPNPAIRLYYRTMSAMGSTVRVQGAALPASDDAWSEHVICLDEQNADVPVQLDLALQFNGGACPSNPARVHFDAVEVIEDNARPCN